MAAIPIHFFYENISFELLKSFYVSQWIERVIINENKTLNLLNFIFTNDEKLLLINRLYLNHNFYTDIITFNLSKETHLIEGDIFISIDRVYENSSLLKISFFEELHRVIIHGVLHLIGYDDSSFSSKAAMRDKENYYLNLRNF